MNTKERPAPRANAGDRDNSEADRTQNKASANDWEAEAAARPGGLGEVREGLSMNRPIGAAQDVFETRAELLRDFVFEALAPVECDAAAARLCLRNDDDAGTRNHLKRVVECVKAAAKTFCELEAPVGRNG
jgi:hypothetical protein